MTANATPSSNAGVEAVHGRAIAAGEARRADRYGERARAEIEAEREDATEAPCAADGSHGDDPLGPARRPS
jgi:hypothetical protein